MKRLALGATWRVDIRLNIPPNGGTMRQTRPPWKRLGMSRTTWYRHGKPSKKPPKRQTQAMIAKKLGRSVRTVQRLQRIWRTSDPDLIAIVGDHKISIGKAEALVRDTVFGDGFIMLPKRSTD